MRIVTSSALSTDRDDEIYPTSDGQPMAESELHAEEMVEIRRMLLRHFEDRAEGTYVGSNLFVYYERGNPRAVFSPDVFVAFGAPQKLRDAYKLWVDGPAPVFVLEVTSKSSRIEDRGNKMALWEMLGVTEYLLYDPRAEYLDPPLRAHRLVGGSYRALALDDRGELRLETLGLSVSLDDRGRLVLRDGRTGERLLRLAEVEARAEARRARAEAERARAEAERVRAEAERDEQRRRADEAERRLAEALARSSGRQ